MEPDTFWQKIKGFQIRQKCFRLEIKFLKYISGSFTFGAGNNFLDLFSI